MKTGNHKHQNNYFHSSIYWVIIQSQLNMFKHIHNRCGVPRVYSDSTPLPMRPCVANMPTDCADREFNDMSAPTDHHSHNYTPATWILLNIMVYCFPSWNHIFDHWNIKSNVCQKNNAFICFLYYIKKTLNSKNAGFDKYMMLNHISMFCLSMLGLLMDTETCLRLSHLKEFLILPKPHH